ncbi:MAG: hypothetical protein NT164_05660 [Verrucomicrobiae bacterium]|nr:hypothetical protein [Verrucomicrobiae bacterium]
MAFFIGCEKKIDLSSQEPYLQAIGKSFVLQQDYYVYTIRGSTHTYLGEDFWLPKQIDSKYIGFDNSEVKILGIAKKGVAIKIKKILLEENIESSYDYYFVSLDNDFLSRYGDLDVSGFLNSFHNPPTTKTWSDPPIFDPKVALPLPSDGIWWK